ncbi:LuxR C-terminal-related transcriptional regulator [Pseudomonas sp. HY13-MNA-CIBAN-0226]|uniref:LuxR C-terminal-related transcriptional regulator n=1 Tax=Pseudomonas sp. HY13-MNA-CIBAN-0226 TaxID=3140473 RepID=UPI0033213E12
MNNTDILTLQKNLRTVISESETIESLWATCLSSTKEINFDYFSYHIQHPIPFSNPKIYTYGNYPLDASRLLTTKKPHTTAGHFRVEPEDLAPLNQTQKKEAESTINLDDRIFFITQSTQKTEGITEHFVLARAHIEIDRIELKKARTIIKIMTDEIARKLAELNNGASRAVTLSPREKEILLWGADGKTSEEIAIILGLSQDSINFHHKTIQKKLNTTNRAQAIAHAIVKGYI